MFCAVLLAASPAVAGEACVSRTFAQASFLVCPFDSRTQTLALAWMDSRGMRLGSFERLAQALGAKARRVRFAMNAGMFDASGTPVGLYVENGTRRVPLDTGPGDGNFYLRPNGVFSLARDGRVRVETSERFAARGATPLWATQSGPMLVIGGRLHPQISPDGPSKQIRNGVGVRDAHTALFVISQTPVSFGTMARFFRDLKCADALYLDGAISGVWVPSLRLQTGTNDFGPMAVVLH